MAMTKGMSLLACYNVPLFHQWSHQSHSVLYYVREATDQSPMLSSLGALFA